MRLALAHAQYALEHKEVPVGCIFVYNNEIIARGRNTVNETKNATRHAEMNCIDQVLDYCVAKELSANEVFSQMEVFVTVEPCIMCMAALRNVGIKEVTFGCRNDRFGGETVFDVNAALGPGMNLVGGYKAERAMSLLKQFYQDTNPNAPLDKVKTKKIST